MTSIDELANEIQERLDFLADYYGVKAKTLLAMPEGTIKELTGRRDSLQSLEQSNGYSQRLN